jgi:hypothetical protein
MWFGTYKTLKRKITIWRFCLVEDHLIRNKSSTLVTYSFKTFTCLGSRPRRGMSIGLSNFNVDPQTSKTCSWPIKLNFKLALTWSSPLVWIAPTIYDMLFCKYLTPRSVLRPALALRYRNLRKLKKIDSWWGCRSIL